MKKRFWVVVGIIFLIAIAALIISHNTQVPDESGKSVKIGLALALTGDAAPWGEESLRAAQLAVDEINADGGVNNKKLELAVEDMKSSTAGGVSAVSKLVNVDEAQAVMITWLDSYAGAESAVPKDILMISQDAAIESVNVPVNHPNVFSMWYRTEAKARVTIDAMKSADIKTLYVVLQHDAYYTKLLEFLKAEAAKQNITIVGEELVNPADDARTVVAKIAERKPDSVFFGSYDEKLSVSFLKNYQQLVGPTITMYGDEFIEQDLSNTNFNASWLEGIAYYVPATPDPEFGKKFQSRFGHEPMFSAGTTYDTVHVIAQYLNDQPEDVAEYMQTTEFDTITYGEISFDEIGGVISKNPAIMMKKIVDGVAVPLK